MEHSSGQIIEMACPALDERDIQAVADSLRSGILAQGPRVSELEQAFAAYTGVKHAVATSNGTTALHTALLAAGIREGDEVLTTPFSFVATANAILYCRARPVFVDIDEDTFNINPSLLRRAVTKKTKAVIVVHLYGQPCDMEEIVETCREHNLVLIEDACQAHGAEYKGKKVGSFGIGCFSFYATKNITTGEGGIITTDDAEVAQKARMIRSHGQSERYVHQILGFNYRMTDFAAALGIRQLQRLDQLNEKRAANAAYLCEQMAGIPGLSIPVVRADRKHVFHQFTVRVSSSLGVPRDDLAARLREDGIMTGIHYPLPIHKQPLYRDMGYDAHLPVSERAAAEVLNLPVHPSLDDQDLKRIVRSVKEAVGGLPSNRKASASRPAAAAGTCSLEPARSSGCGLPLDSAKAPRNVVMRGKVNIGKGTVVEDNVVLGHRDDGVLTIGENSRIRSGSVIYSDVVIGSGLKTGHNVLIREGTKIGDDVLVGTNTVVDGHCRIGNRVVMQTNVYVTAHTIVEDGVFLGPCSVTTNDKYMEYGAKLVGPTIRKGARIGANSTILPGVTVGEGAVIGSGTVVTKDVPDGAVVAGNPARELPSRVAGSTPHDSRMKSR